MSDGTFGRRFLKALADAGVDRGQLFKDKEFGQLLGVTGQTVSDWKNGRSEPDYGRMRQIADVLGVRACWLAFGEEPMVAAEQHPSISVEPEPEAERVAPRIRRRKRSG